MYEKALPFENKGIWFNNRGFRFLHFDRVKDENKNYILLMIIFSARNFIEVSVVFLCRLGGHRLPGWAAKPLVSEGYFDGGRSAGRKR
ncbi:MAG: hypothetical protein JSR51_04300 [Proteobacteria bacterium]|nr:hypothetical protein [Pseudomonadota bacterium]